MHRINCWQFKKCGREPGGEKADELGVCPAATEDKTHGYNEGRYGGRICWAISGTFCQGEVKGTYAAKISSCVDCDFFKLVQKEQGGNFMGARELLNSDKNGPDKE